MKGRILSFIKGQCRNKVYKTLRFSGTSRFFVMEQEIVRSNFFMKKLDFFIRIGYYNNG